MMLRRLCVLLAVALTTFSPSVRADEEKKPSDFEKQIDGLTKVEGLWTMYHNDQKLLVALKSADLSKDYIVLTSIARGISSGMVLGGMSWGFGDDALWTFKKVGEKKIHVIRRNVRFRAKKDSPEETAVRLAYSDSVLYALPIVAKTPDGGYLVDMSRVFLSDDWQIGRAIGGGFRFSSDRSTWAKVKAFPHNVELQVAAVYSGSGTLDTVSDPRGVQVHVHHSISELPKNGYKPRLADDRVGYFLTVLKDFSDDSDDEHFVRYINRWNLKKKDPEIDFSPPEEPITFWIEKTVPVYLRPTVRAGIEEWNKAFEEIGFAGAIEVRQQTDDADWDPEDIRYNTFRWITADAGFAMGPSRVDPRTGQILDADIIFDAGFLNYWSQEYETFSEEDVAALLPNYRPDPSGVFPTGHNHLPGASCAYCNGMSHQLGYAAAVLSARGISADGELPDEFIHQGLKEVVMHEVGHTLGLRHNFKASTWKTLEEIRNSGPDEPTVASVMDYIPAVISPKGVEQGPYFTSTIGPYDRWAIEYGYKPIKSKEQEELKKIAARSGEDGLDFATDEDTRTIDSDPLTNRFDIGKNPIAFARQQMEIVDELLPQVVERTVKDGNGYQRARRAFGLLLSEYYRSALYAARFAGGVVVNRDHKADERAEPPFQVVSADEQRAGVKLLLDSALAPPTVKADTLNHLAASRWNHWGLDSIDRLDYPIHDVIGRMQRLVLRRLLDPVLLTRLRDNELKVATDADSYTLAEHLDSVTHGVFAEWYADKPAGEFSARQPYIASFRRDLQRSAVKELSAMVLSGYNTPEDARTLARLQLDSLKGEADRLLAIPDVSLDAYTRAHLMDTRQRIEQVLEAELDVRSIN